MPTVQITVSYSDPDAVDVRWDRDLGALESNFQNVMFTALQRTLGVEQTVVSRYSATCTVAPWVATPAQVAQQLVRYLQGEEFHEATRFLRQTHQFDVVPQPVMRLAP